MFIYIYFVIFFIAGISGLIYESIWSQYIKHFLGHAAYSQTLVLVIYMGGMALGSWIVSLKTSKCKDLLSVYALVQVLLGIAALLFHGFYLRYLDFSYETVIPFLDNPLLISLYKWITASVIILPQSVLLGATFPLMAGGVVRKFPGLSGYKISTLYFVNSLGASIGVLWSGFFLVERYGLRGAIVTGGLFDMVVGVLVYYLCRRDANSDLLLQTAASVNASSEKEACFEIITPDSKKRYYHPLLAIACLTATASFMYEIGWIRMLSLVLGSSTHSFELMLSAFIFGLALGSFLIAEKIDKIENVPRFLAIVQILMGTTALITLFTYGNMFEVMRYTINALERNQEGYFFFNIISHVICLLLMLPTTVCAGMVIPLVTHILMKKGFGEQAIGKVYALNTFGGIIGVILAIWVVMPVFGLRLLVSLGGILDIAIGLYILYTFAETRQEALKTLLTPACVVIVLIALTFGHLDPVLMSSGVFRYGNIATNKRIVSHRDGRTATVSLFETARNMVLSTNGKPDASIGLDGHSSDEYTMAMLGVIPMVIKDQAADAAVIGMGAGMTSHYLLYDDQFESVDVIEIEREMVRAAKRMGERVANTFTDDRSNIYYADAKSFFSSRNKTYDIIISEPSNPWVSGVSGLFSKEFFARIKNHLNQDGILVQWFHKYECDISVVASILKALRENFPRYELFSVGSDYIIVASENPAADLSVKRDVFEIETLGNSLKRMGFSSIDDIRHLRFTGNKVLDPLIDHYPYPANSDYHPFVDLHAVKHRYMGNHVEEFNTIAKSVVPLRKIAEWDTVYIPFDLYRFFPDVPNLTDIYDAKEYYNRLVHGDGHGGVSVSISDPALMTLAHAAANPEAVSFYQLQVDIFRILEKTLPYLSATEMANVWEAIGKKTSYMQFGHEEALWMEFFGALCNYNMFAVNDLARLLLPLDKIVDGYATRVLIASLFIAAADVGDYTELDDIWRRYEARDNPHLIVRLARDIAGIM